MKNLRTFIEALHAKNEIVEIDVEVDPYLELAEIHRRVIEQGGKALLFKRVKGSPFPAVTNLFGTIKRIDIAFGPEPEAFVSRLAHLAHDMLPPKFSKLWSARDLAWKGLKVGLTESAYGPVLENKMSLASGKGLDLLPAVVQWPEDGGRFVTLPLVYTENPLTKKSNLGMYRIHLYDSKTTGMHWQIERGSGNHYHIAEQRNEALPTTLFIGGPPALMIAAIAPLPEDIPELLAASLLMGEKLPRCRTSESVHPLVAEAEFAVIGHVPPHKRRLEGPFGDHFGYYSHAHNYPVFEVDHIFHRNDAIYPATIVGKPRQEDFFIGDYLQRLLSPLFPLVMPSVKELHSCGETGFHGLAIARVKERYPREAMKSAFGILGQGQLSLQKCLMLTDGDVDLTDFKKVLIHFLERTLWQRDLFVISQVSQDTLDYTGPKVNEGSKKIWLALGDAIRTLNGEIKQPLPSFVKNAGVYVPGCLVIECPAYKSHPNLVNEIRELSCFKDFEMVLLVDNVTETLSSSEKLMWTWFTRFEPANDIYAAKTELNRFHVSLTSPVFFDCRMKPWYPSTVEPDEKTVKLVDRRWGEYFPELKWKA